MSAKNWSVENGEQKIKKKPVNFANDGEQKTKKKPVNTIESHTIAKKMIPSLSKELESGLLNGSERTQIEGEITKKDEALFLLVNDGIEIFPKRKVTSTQFAELSMRSMKIVGFAPMDTTGIGASFGTGITSLSTTQINSISISLVLAVAAFIAVKTASQLLITLFLLVAAALNAYQTLSRRVDRVIHLRKPTIQKNGFRNNPFMMQSAGRLS